MTRRPLIGVKVTPDILPSRLRRVRFRLRTGGCFAPSVTPVSTFWHCRRSAGGLLILPE